MSLLLLDMDVAPALRLGDAFVQRESLDKSTSIPISKGVAFPHEVCVLHENIDAQSAV